jgi:hypothetical protein
MRIVLIFLVSVASLASSTPDQRIRLTVNSDAAEAALAYVDLRARGEDASTAWQRLIASEPYRRLHEREAAMQRPFTDDEFRAYLDSPDLASRNAHLRETLAAWRSADLQASAQRVLQYLPANARIRAKVFLMIKPKTNSFVFDTKNDPTIFMYLDPAVTPAKFENTIAHELHHIGFASVTGADERLKTLPPRAQDLWKWAGAFGEGFAMLAAAGSAVNHPHAASEPQDRERWDRDVANFARDLRTLNTFFLDMLNGNFETPDGIQNRAMSFFGDAQGPWYTVGWKMAVLIEERFGKAALIKAMADPHELLSRYNQIARKEQLPIWDDEIIRALAPSK